MPHSVNNGVSNKIDAYRINQHCLYTQAVFNAGKLTVIDQ
jgi:hypothetical protein